MEFKVQKRLTIFNRCWKILYQLLSGFYIIEPFFIISLTFPMNYYFWGLIQFKISAYKSITNLKIDWNGRWIMIVIKNKRNFGTGRYLLPPDFWKQVVHVRWRLNFNYRLQPKHWHIFYIPNHTKSTHYSKFCCYLLFTLTLFGCSSCHYIIRQKSLLFNK